ncbi:MAG: MFS transporter [Actinomycetota bacterium]|nr:MFS transporter [Actinomycetota bacterium]
MQTIETTPPVPVQTAAVGWWPLVLVLAGTFVTFLDFFIVNVALPSIDAELGAGPSALSLVVAGYGLTFAAGMITGGRLGDLFGRRRMFAIGLALFALTSAACGFAPTIGVLVTARFLQGAAGALLTPQVLAIIGTVYSGARRGRAFAAYGFAMGIAGVLGQLLGGALISADLAGLGWRIIFLINLPIGLLALPRLVRVIPDLRAERTGLDGVGTVLVTLAALALVLPLVEGREHGWPVWCWALLAIAPVLGMLFVGQQRRRGAAGQAPLVDLALFRQRRFTVGLLMAVTFCSVPPSLFFVLALFLQQGRGFHPLFAGTLFVTVGVGYFAATMVALPIGQRIGAQVLALGALMVAAGCALLAASVSAPSSLALLPGLAVAGIGIGLVLVPLAATVLDGLDPRHAGAASGVLSMAQQVGGAVGVAITGLVFFGRPSIAAGFTASMWLIVGLTVIAALLVQLLGRVRAEAGEAAPATAAG